VKNVFFNIFGNFGFSFSNANCLLGIIPKINPGKTPAQERENIAFFLAGNYFITFSSNRSLTFSSIVSNISHHFIGCKQLGLRDTQLFVTNDLYEGFVPLLFFSSLSDLKNNLCSVSVFECEGQRVRTVAITLYWLGRAARARPQYKGPQLKLTAFAKMNCNRCKKPITGTHF
jgi:hypothetical protein